MRAKLSLDFSIELIMLSFVRLVLSISCLSALTNYDTRQVIQTANPAICFILHHLKETSRVTCPFHVPKKSIHRHAALILRIYLSPSFTGSLDSPRSQPSPHRPFQPHRGRVRLIHRLQHIKQLWQPCRKYALRDFPCRSAYL